MNNVVPFLQRIKDICIAISNVTITKIHSKIRKILKANVHRLKYIKKTKTKKTGNEQLKVDNDSKGIFVFQGYKEFVKWRNQLEFAINHNVVEQFTEELYVPARPPVCITNCTGKLRIVSHDSRSDTYICMRNNNCRNMLTFVLPGIFTNEDLKEFHKAHPCQVEHGIYTYDNNYFNANNCFNDGINLNVNDYCINDNIDLNNNFDVIESSDGITNGSKTILPLPELNLEMMPFSINSNGIELGECPPYDANYFCDFQPFAIESEKIASPNYVCQKVSSNTPCDMPPAPKRQKIN